MQKGNGEFKTPWLRQSVETRLKEKTIIHKGNTYTIILASPVQIKLHYSYDTTSTKRWNTPVKKFCMKSSSELPSPIPSPNPASRNSAALLPSSPPSIPSGIYTFSEKLLLLALNPFLSPSSNRVLILNGTGTDRWFRNPPGWLAVLVPDSLVFCPRFISGRCLSAGGGDDDGKVGEKE